MRIDLLDPATATGRDVDGLHAVLVAGDRAVGHQQHRRRGRS